MKTQVKLTIIRHLKHSYLTLGFLRPDFVSYSVRVCEAHPKRGPYILIHDI